MVGVPGKSKGCNTCRRRKKGCDLQKPICGQCHKARIECTGYERQRVFVNTTSQHIGQTLQVTRRLPEITLPDSLTRSAYEERYLGLFWEAYLPNGTAFTEKTFRYTTGGWTVVIQDLYRTNIALRKGLLALCLGTISRRDGLDWMVGEALGLYVGALGEMTTALTKPTTLKENALMCTSRILSLYELLFGVNEHDRLAQARGWQGHILGELAMIVQGTPEANVHGHAHQLFVDGRLHQINLSVKLRRRTVLSSPEWKTVPWSIKPKTAKDVLIDILVDCPGHLEDLDVLRACGDACQKDILRQRLVANCQQSDKELMWWFEHLSPQEDFADAVSNRFSCPTQGDVAVAHVMAMYWTTCILVYSTLRLAVGPDAQLPDHTNPRIYCKNIADLMPIFFQPSAGIFAVHLTPFPMGVALTYLITTEKGICSDERQRLAGFFWKKDCGGEAVGNFLQSMLRDTGIPETVAKDGFGPIKDYARRWFGPGA